MRFFSEAEGWVDIPQELDDDIMEEAMAGTDEAAQDNCEVSPEFDPLYRKRLALLRVARGERRARERLEKEYAELTEQLQEATKAKILAEEQLRQAKEHLRQAEEQARQMTAQLELRQARRRAAGIPEAR